MMFRIRIGVFCLLLPFGAQGGAQAQDAQTLADIRQELTMLNLQIKELKRELTTTSSGFGATASGALLDRIEGSESALQRLTGKTEALEFRIEQIVRDGTTRIGDLEFRLVELEGGDVSTLGETSTLGGDVTATDLTQEAQGHSDDTGQLAAQEKTDFDRATAALEAQDFQTAATQFERFNQTYPGGPLSAQARIGQAQALEGMGDTRSAARMYLDVFSADQNGPSAGLALFHLGRALEGLGQTQEACVTLDEVSTRFPNSAAAQQAQNHLKNMRCS